MPHIQTDGHRVHRQVNIQAQQANECRGRPEGESEAISECHGAVEDDAPANGNRQWYGAKHNEVMSILVDVQLHDGQYLQRETIEHAYAKLDQPRTAQWPLVQRVPDAETQTRICQHLEHDDG